jgi:hypothetical protein
MFSMPSNHRRRGPAGRPYLKPAPAPAAEQSTAQEQEPARTAALDEDQPWEHASQVTYALTQDEYDELRDRGQSGSDAKGTSALTEVPAPTANVDDEDVAFARPTIAAPARQSLADIELGDNEPPDRIATRAAADLDRPTLDEGQNTESAPAAGAEHDPENRADDHGHDLRELSFAIRNAPGPAPRTLGSASIDTAPVRRSRHRPAQSQDFRVSRANLSWFRLSLILVTVAVVAVLGLAIVLNRTSHTSPRAPRPAPASAAQVGSSTLRQALTPITREIQASSAAAASVADRAATHSAARAAELRHRAAHHRQQHHAAPQPRRIDATTPVAAPSPAAITPTTSAPVAAAPTRSSSGSSGSSAGSKGSSSPPPYGQGGMLGAGHVG